MLAAPGTDFVDIQLAQRRTLGVLQGATEQALIASEPVVRELFTAVQQAANKDAAMAAVMELLTPEALRALGAQDVHKEAIAREITRDWLMFLLHYDAAAVLSKIDIPVLAVNGALDWQVPADENLAAIEAALTHNADVTIRKLDRLNHLFQTAETGEIQEYVEIEETFSPVALELISGWINARFGADR